MRLKEPVTSITDFLLAVELFLFSFLTFRANTAQLSVTFWAIALAVLGLSALAGGLYHGVTSKLGLWRVTAACMVATLGFMIAAGILSAFAGILRAALLLITEISILILTLRLALKERGSVSVRNSQKRIVLFLILLAAALAYHLSTNGPAVGVWMLAGSVIIFAGLWIQQSKISLHKNFNHNDLCHIFFMAGLYFLYRGGLLLRDH